MQRVNCGTGALLPQNKSRQKNRFSLLKYSLDIIDIRLLSPLCCLYSVHMHTVAANGRGSDERHARVDLLTSVLLYTCIVVRADCRLCAGACQIRMLSNFVFASISLPYV
jgi:hypothetical protein